MMRKLPISVVLAWVFGITISICSLIQAGQTLIQRLSTGQSIELASEFVMALLPMFFALPAVLIILRQPRNIIGWLLMILPLAALPITPMPGYLSRFKDTPPPATFLTISPRNHSSLRT